MTNSSPQPTAASPDPHKPQQVLEDFTEVPTRGSQQVPVLTPALRSSDPYALQWLPSRPPTPPQPTSAPVQGLHCPQAVPFQQLTLDGLNNDVLAIVIDYIHEESTMQVCHWNWNIGRKEPKTGFGFRAKGTSLFCLSLVSKRMRAISIPKLFAHVFRCASSMGALNRRLRDLEGNPLIPSLPEVLPAIKACDIVTTSRGKTTFCRTRLAKTLPKMVSLVELSITHRKDVDISGLRATFQRHEVTLPTVLRLRILSHGDWSFLVEACPNTETLALEYNLGHDGLMETVATLKRLKLVEICCDAWQLEDIQRLHQYLPDLQSLVLRGAIGHEQISSFATAFGLFQRLTNLSITARQEITDEDEEEQFSDDDSGDGSAVGDMYWEHELDEEQSFVARSFFEHCHVLETLSLVRVGQTTPWYPVRGNDGALESVYSPQMDRQAWNDTYMLERQEHDDEGFPRLFTFRRQTEYDESWENPSYGDQSREATEHRLKERDRYYAIKQEALGLGLWEGDSRWHG